MADQITSNLFSDIELENARQLLTIGLASSHGNENSTNSISEPNNQFGYNNKMNTKCGIEDNFLERNVILGDGNVHSSFITGQPGIYDGMSVRAIGGIGAASEFYSDNADNEEEEEDDEDNEDYEEHDNIQDILNNNSQFNGQNQNLNPIVRQSYVDRDEFNEAINIYVQRLHDTKQEKALLTAEGYNTLLSCLLDPRDTSLIDAQYRHWAREGHRVLVAGNAFIIADKNGKPLAVREQIYDVLASCHDATFHAGRDKTAAVVFSLFSGIPKELVGEFVRLCKLCQKLRPTGVENTLKNKQQRKKQAEIQHDQKLDQSYPDMQNMINQSLSQLSQNTTQPIYFTQKDFDTIPFE